MRSDGGRLRAFHLRYKETRDSPQQRGREREVMEEQAPSEKGRNRQDGEENGILNEFAKVRRQPTAGKKKTIAP